MTQREAPNGTRATIGHPANRTIILKWPDGNWRYEHNGKRVNDEDFRAGWDILILGRR